ncbi:MAG: hypothetical protein R2710_07955 [Acidimicrobiales bacterium]
MRRGPACPVRLLERAPEVYDLRAIVMDDEIQRVFQKVGLDAGLAEITTPLAGAEFVTTEGERIIQLRLPPTGTFPYGHHPRSVTTNPSSRRSSVRRRSTPAWSCCSVSRSTRSTRTTPG